MWYTSNSALMRLWECNDVSSFYAGDCLHAAPGSSNRTDRLTDSWQKPLCVCVRSVQKAPSLIRLPDFVKTVANCATNDFVILREECKVIAAPSSFKLLKWLSNAAFHAHGRITSVHAFHHCFKLILISLDNSEWEVITKADSFAKTLQCNSIVQQSKQDLTMAVGVRLESRLRNRCINVLPCEIFSWLSFILAPQISDNFHSSEG